IIEKQIEEGQTSLLESTRGRVIHLAGVGEQGDQHDNTEDLEPRNFNEESSDAAVADQTEESDHVVQDEGVQIVTDDEIQAIVADKPKGTRKKRKAASGASSYVLPLKRLREDHDTSRVAGASTAGKSFVVLQCFLESSTLAVETFLIILVKMLQMMKSLLLSVPHSIFKDYAFPSTTEADIASPSHPDGAEVSTNTFYVSQDMNSETLQQMYVPQWNVINDSALDDPKVCPSYQLVERGGSKKRIEAPYLMLVNKSLMLHRVVRQACFIAKVRLRSEHNYKERMKFKRKYARLTCLLREKDVEIANLKACLNEQNVALEVDKGTLEGQVVALEFAVSAKDNEHASLTAQVSSLEATCSRLHDQVLGYEFFKEQYEAVQDEEVKILSDKVAGLVVGIDHGKAGIDFVDFVAYNPSAEANYVFAVNALRAIDFPFLTQLESRKDASFADIMCLLHLKRIRGDAVSQRLSIFDAMVPLVEPLSFENLVGEASTSGVPGAVATTTALLTTFVQASSISPIPALDYKVVDTKPQVESSSSPKMRQTARVGKLNSLNEQNVALEVDKGTLEGQVAALEFAVSAKDNEHASLTAQGMQDRLVVGIDHGKAGRDFVDFVAYNPSAEANYVFAVNALHATDFPFLTQLESRKDASFADIMCLLHLKRIRGDAVSQRLSISDAMVPLVEPLSFENLVGEASTSGVPGAVATTTALLTTFVQAGSISPIPALDYKVVDTKPQVESSSSPKIIFDQETLMTSSEYPAT
nr:hypothetical protein [Tanacetum cinerariifolium]